MKRSHALSALFCTSFLPACGSTAGPPPYSPRAAIAALATRFTGAWNAHDPQTFAQTFTPDADFTNVYGVHVHSRSAIAAFHAKIFLTVFKDSYQTTEAIDFDSIDGASARVRVHWSMTGATIPTWPSVQHGIITWTLAQNADGSWSIAVMTNELAVAGIS